MMARPPSPRLLACALLPLAAACADQPALPDAPPPDAPKVLGVVEVTITGIGGPSMSARARAVDPAALAGGPRLTLSRPNDSGGTGDGSIQLKVLSTGGFTDGTRAGGGYRYVQATLQVRNAQSNGTAYDTPRQNLTFLGAALTSALEGTAFTSILRFDGTPAAAGLATQVVPTGGVHRNFTSGAIGTVPDVLQVLTEAEVGALFPPAGIASVLPYGFMVRNPATPGSRTLPASPAAEQWDGLVTIAFRVPLQPTVQEDAYTVVAQFLVVDDTQTRITQAPEEQTTLGGAAFANRASTLGASQVTLFPGSAYGGAIAQRMVCDVRTAGLAGAATATLAPCPAVGTVLVTPDSTGLLQGESVQLSASVTDVSGDPAPWAPVTWSSSDESVATVSATGLVSAVGAGTATITATADGVAGDATVTSLFLLPQTITAGDGHSCGLTTTGAAYCWGLNGFDQLGAGSGAGSTEPTPVAVAGGHTFASVSAGDLHTCGLTRQGKAYCWGSDGSGKLGDGPAFAAADTPVAVAGGHTFARISVGGSHTVAITAAGVAYAWGGNGAGQLGDGTTTVRDAPVLVSGGHAFARIDAGGDFTCGVTTAGAAYCWGYNRFGQLGDGTTTDRTVPTAVSGGHVLTEVSVGALHAVALTGAGTAYGWGYNVDGQVGDGTTTDRHVPTAASGGVAFATVSAGGGHTMALTGAGAAYAWGANASGQLGDGTNTPRDVPTAVGAGTVVGTVSAGTAHTCGVTAAGAAYCWGSDQWEQLGDGSSVATSSNVPVAVLGGLTFALP